MSLRLLARLVLFFTTCNVATAASLCDFFLLRIGDVVKLNASQRVQLGWSANKGKYAAVVTNIVSDSKTVALLPVSRTRMGESFVNPIRLSKSDVLNPDTLVGEQQFKVLGQTKVKYHRVKQKVRNVPLAVDLSIVNAGDMVRDVETGDLMVILSKVLGDSGSEITYSLVNRQNNSLSLSRTYVVDKINGGQKVVILGQVYKDLTIKPLNRARRRIAPTPVQNGTVIGIDRERYIVIESAPFHMPILLYENTGPWTIFRTYSLEGKQRTNFENEIPIHISEGMLNESPQNFYRDSRGDYYTTVTNLENGLESVPNIEFLDQALVQRHIQPHLIEEYVARLPPNFEFSIVPTFRLQLTPKR